MFDRSALSPIPRELWSFFLPQLDQLKGTPVHTRAGVGVRIDSELARGWFWACAVAPDCLVCSLRVEIHRDFTLAEAPERDCLALCMVSSCDVESLGNLRQVLLPARDETILLLPTTAANYDYDLKAGAVHGGTNICALPSYVERARTAADLAPHEHEALLAACGKPQDLSSSSALRAAMRSIAPVDCDRPGARALYAARAQEACSLAAIHLLEATQDARRPQIDSLAAQVDAILRQSLAQPPSLDQLAAHLYLSRTQLCQRFRDQTGMTVGQRLAQLRMGEAQALLLKGQMSVRDVAAAVGFAHQSSFNAAFKRAFGRSPSAWREERVPRVAR